MRSGALRHLVTIEKETRVADAAGGYSTTWSTFAANVWAGIEPLSALEHLRASQLEQAVTHRIRLRYSDDVKGLLVTHRIKFGTRLFNLTGIVNPDERNREFEVLAVEGSAL